MSDCACLPREIFRDWRIGGGEKDMGGASIAEAGSVIDVGDGFYFPHWLGCEMA